MRTIQLRDKALHDRAHLAAAEGVAALCRPAGARAFVNDRVDIAALAGTGVHLGEDDLPASEARAILPPGALIGVSTHDAGAARRALRGPGLRLRGLRSGLRERDEVGAAAPRPRGARARGGADGRSRSWRSAASSPARLDAVWDAGADAAAMIGGLYAGGRIEENTRAALDRGRRRGRRRRIYLVGFMAAGKSSVGRRVAERLDLPFVDLDDEIERTSGRTIRALFEESGEAAFREREAAFLAATESLPAAVVATGGGCFAREENRRRVARLGTAVFLDVPLATVRARLKGKTDRPLFQSEEQLGSLFAERSPFYRMAPVAAVLGGAETIEEAADRVLIALDDFDTLQG